MADFLENARQILRQEGKSPGTASSYLSHVRKLYIAFGERLADLQDAEIRGYLEETTSQVRSTSYAAQARSAIRFLYVSVLGRPDPLSGWEATNCHERIDGVFTRSEITRILAGTPDPGHRLALSLIYASGLRTGETTVLRRRNIDVDRMIIHVNDRSGHFLRDSILSRSSLDLMNEHLIGRKKESLFLFPGRGGNSCISPRTLQHAFAQALTSTDIPGHASLGWLRHSFAVHLLEDGIDRRLIQDLMGIGTASMMSPYVKLASKSGKLRILSPIDRFLKCGGGLE